MALPTPAGVPVEMISPGSSVTYEEMNSITAATGKICIAVLESCLISPLTFSVRRSFWGSGMASALVTHGPTGQKPDNQDQDRNQQEQDEQVVRTEGARSPVSPAGQARSPDRPV